MSLVVEMGATNFFFVALAAAITNRTVVKKEWQAVDILHTNKFTKHANYLSLKIGVVIQEKRSLHFIKQDHTLREKTLIPLCIMEREPI